MGALRKCRVSTKGLDGVEHSVEVHASTLFEAAATALKIFRDQGWATEALTPNAVLRVEVQPPATVHAVPVKAVEVWLRSPSTPKELLMKRHLGGGGAE